jgi:predicted nucleic acid-binding protein
MTLSRFPTSPTDIIVADASVLINLNATGHFETIVRASVCAVHVTQNAFHELQRGSRNGHKDASTVDALAERGLITIVPLAENAEPVYRSLIEGHASETLDDGEAATIAQALAIAGVALIDEKKANRICIGRFPDLCVASTAELLLDSRVSAALGASHADAVLLALTGARMNVPLEHLDAVRRLIGEDNASRCRSLPQRRACSA